MSDGPTPRQRLRRFFQPIQVPIGSLMLLVVTAAMPLATILFLHPWTRSTRYWRKLAPDEYLLVAVQGPSLFIFVDHYVNYVNTWSFAQQRLGWHRFLAGPMKIDDLVTELMRDHYSVPASGGVGYINVLLSGPPTKPYWTPVGRIDTCGVHFERLKSAHDAVWMVRFKWYHLYIPTLVPYMLMSRFVWIRRSRRVKALRCGLCLKCGYDLRASSERCPECGTPNR